MEGSPPGDDDEGHDVSGEEGADDSPLSDDGGGEHGDEEWIAELDADAAELSGSADDGGDLSDDAEELLEIYFQGFRARRRLGCKGPGKGKGRGKGRGPQPGRGTERPRESALEVQRMQQVRALGLRCRE